MIHKPYYVSINQKLQLKKWRIYICKQIFLSQKHTIYETYLCSTELLVFHYTFECSSLNIYYNKGLLANKMEEMR